MKCLCRVASNLWGELAIWLIMPRKRGCSVVLVGVLMLTAGFHLVMVWGDAVYTDDVTKEIEGIFAKLALLLVQAA